jgi:hypothetical protein
MRLIPAMRDLYQDLHPFIVIQKAAQVFVSEYLVNTALWAADTGQGGRGNVLFVMPTQNQVDDFSQARFDRAIAESPYLSTRLYPPPPGRGGPARMRLKRLGQGYIYLRGADSRRQLTSVDADVVLLDEYDLMAEGVLELAQKRLASSRVGWLRAASTPRYPEAGISGLFLRSDQRYYFLKCQACGRDQRLEWEANVDKEHLQVVCCRTDCRKPLDPWAKGHWEAAAPGNTEIRGYHLSRLYSPLANLRQMVWESEATTPLAAQEFQNAVLGETFVPPNGGLRFDDLDRCRADYLAADYGGQPCVMGVDVGLKFHVVIREVSARQTTASPPPSASTPFVSRLWFAGEADFADLPGLMSKFNVRTCAIDLLPERHLVSQLVGDSRSSVWPVDYGRSEPGYEVSDSPRQIHAHRVDLMDQVAARFRKAEVSLPRAGRELGGRLRDGFGEYYREMTAPQRLPIRDSRGNLDYRWDDRGRDDHYYHSELYALLAEKVRDRYLIFPAW